MGNPIPLPGGSTGTMLCAAQGTSGLGFAHGRRALHPKSWDPALGTNPPSMPLSLCPSAQGGDGATEALGQDGVG